MNSLVTVIIPVYNTEKYIKRAVDSILNQKYKNIEIIVINDVSTDKSLQVLTKNYGTNKKVNIITNKRNIGCYASMNEGVIKSKGDFITVLGSDDWFHKDRVYKDIADLVKYPNKLAVQSKYVRIDEATKKRKYDSWGGTPVTFRKVVFSKMGYFDSIRFSGDTEYLKRFIYVFGLNRLHKIERCLYIASYRPNSLTTNKLTRKSSIRQEYQRGAEKYRLNTPKHKIFVPYPLKKRLFPCHKIQKGGY